MAEWWRDLGNKKLEFRNSVLALIYLLEIAAIYFFLSICDRTNSGMLLIPVMTNFNSFLAVIPIL